MNSGEATLMDRDGRALVLNKVPVWRKRKSMANYIALLPYIFFALFPFYIMFITSIKSDREINNLGQSPFWATGVATENYVYLATNTGFFEHWILNTFIATVVSTVISVISAATGPAPPSSRNASRSTRPCIAGGAAKPWRCRNVGAKSTLPVGDAIRTPPFRSGPAATKVFWISNGLALPWPATPACAEVPRNPYSPTSLLQSAEYRICAAR